MPETNKSVLKAANAALTAGDNEGFLAFCTDDTEWTFVGDKTLRGKEAVREWMATEYTEPPKFAVAELIAEGDFVVAVGIIVIKNEKGEATDSLYSDVWLFRGDKIAGLTAFVIETKSADETDSVV